MTKNEHVYAICCRLYVADDVISGEVKIPSGTTFVYIFGYSTFREYQNQSFLECEDDSRLGPLQSHFRGQRVKMHNGLQKKNEGLGSPFLKL